MVSEHIVRASRGCRLCCFITPAGGSDTPLSSQITTEKHRMSFPETVDEILDVSEDEGRSWRPRPPLCTVDEL